MLQNFSIFKKFCSFEVSINHRIVIFLSQFTEN